MNIYLKLSSWSCKLRCISLIYVNFFRFAFYFHLNNVEMTCKYRYFFVILHTKKRKNDVSTSFLGKNKDNFINPLNKIGKK